MQRKCPMKRSLRSQTTVHSDSKCDQSQSSSTLLPAAIRLSSLLDDSSSTTPLYPDTTNVPNRVRSGPNTSRPKKKARRANTATGDDSFNCGYLTPEELDDTLCECFISFTLDSVCIILQETLVSLVSNFSRSRAV